MTRRGMCAPGSPGTRLASAEVTRGLRGTQQAGWSCAARPVLRPVLK